MHIVTGWNRGGLTYVRRLLQAHGYRVGSDVFTAQTTFDNLADRLKSGADFEVSSFAVPFLGSALLASAKVTFVVRDPLRVLNSLYFLGRFHAEGNGGELQPFAYAHLPGLKSHFYAKPAQAGGDYLLRWLQQTDTLRNGRVGTVRVEEGPIALLKALTGRKHLRPIYVSMTLEASNCEQQLLPSGLPPELRATMQLLLQRLGYFEKEWLPRGGHAHYVNADWHC